MGEGAQMRKKKKKETLPEPAMIIGPVLSEALRPLENWHFAIYASYQQAHLLAPHGINATHLMEKSVSQKIGHAANDGFSPIFLAGQDWMADGNDLEVANNVIHVKATVVDCSEAYTHMLPAANLSKMVQAYKDGVLPFVSYDEMSQKERVGRWLAAHGWAMVNGEEVEFGFDWEYLRRMMEFYKVADIEAELKEVRRMYDQSEDTEKRIANSQSE